MMIELRSGDQVIRYDREAIAACPGPFRGSLDRLGTVAGEGAVQVSESPHFSYFLTTGAPCPQEFRTGPSLAVDFTAHLKWVLAEHWDSGRRQA